MRTPRLTRRLAALATSLVLLTATGALTACGDDAGTPAAASDTKPLRVGYQRFGGLSLVKARNAAPGVTWSLFESGPALTEALKAGAIDIGQTGEAPPIFAAAGKTDFKIIGTSQPVPQGEAVLVHTDSGFNTFADLKGKKVALNKGSNVNWLLLKLLEAVLVHTDSGFNTFADLKGKKVALNKGSNVNWLLLKLLEANNLKLTDIQVTYLKPAEARPAFDNKQVDAWIIWDPYFALAEQPGVKVIADATNLASNREYLLVAPQALESKGDQLKTFLTAYRQTTDWGIANPAERAKILAPELKIAEDVATRALSRSAKPLAPVTPAIGDELQAIADGFAGLQLIPEKIDIKARIDDRYASILQ